MSSNETEKEKIVQCKFCRSSRATKLNKYENLFFCGNCESAFCHPLPGDKELVDYYENQYWGISPIPESVTPHASANFFTKIIKKYNPKAKTLCDVGCGYGALLKGFAEQGFDVVGLEYSKLAVKFIQEELGLNVVQGSIRDIKSNFDVISLRHMLEHSKTPYEDLKNTIQRLNKNGLFIISVPNYNSLASNLLKNRWEWYAYPNHLFYFTLDSFKYFAKKNGLEIIYTETAHAEAKELSWCLKDYTTAIEMDEGIKNSLNKIKKLVQQLEKQENSKTIEDLGLGEELTVIMQVKQQ